jgi:glutamine synthetase
MSIAPKTPKELVEFVQKEGIQVIDLRFMDFPGIWQHVSIPASSFDEAFFETGLGFDGSSIRGWQAINESDMLMRPAPETAFVDPFFEAKTLVLSCTIHDPVTGQDYSRDPRNIAKKAEAYLKASGIGDIAYLGPEAEFFIFDDVRFDQTQNQGFYYLDSVEGRWNMGREEFPNHCCRQDRSIHRKRTGTGLRLAICVIRDCDTELAMPQEGGGGNVGSLGRLFRG